MAVTDPQILNLVPQVVDLEAYQGNTLVLTVTLVNKDGSVYPITGSTSSMKVKRFNGSEVLSLGIGTGIAYTNAAGGIMTVTITPAQMLTLPTETPLKYDIKLSQSSGAVVTYIVRGTIVVTSKIT